MKNLLAKLILLPFFLLVSLLLPTSLPLPISLLMFHIVSDVAFECAVDDVIAAVGLLTLIKKIKFSSYRRKFRVEQLQSHI